MFRSRPSLLLALILLPLLLGSGGRMAQMTTPRPVDDSNERYTAELSDSDKSDRLYAARTLRSRLRIALRNAERGRPGSLRQDQAYAALDDFEDLVAPACVQALTTRNIAHHCASILGMLAHQPAVQALETLRDDEDAKRRARKRATEVLEDLEATQPHD